MNKKLPDQLQDGAATGASGAASSTSGAADAARIAATKISDAPPVKLDRPGAGLPWPERWIVRYWLGPRYSRTPWEISQSIFEKETARILKLIEGLSPEELEKPVLIPRPRGLEDSSRFWSIAMTLDHLLIVSDGTGGLAVALSHGQPGQAPVDTAKVKPRAMRAGSEVIAEFRSRMPSHAAGILTRVKDRASPLTHPHPWFGPFTAQQWFWIMGTHQGLHRKQIEAILRELRPGAPS